MTPEQAKKLQAAYQQNRRKWAELIGRPYPEERDKFKVGETKPCS